MKKVTLKLQFFKCQTLKSISTRDPELRALLNCCLNHSTNASVKCYLLESLGNYIHPTTPAVLMSNTGEIKCSSAAVTDNNAVIRRV